MVICSKFHNGGPQILGAIVPVDVRDLCTPERDDGYFLCTYVRVFIIGIVKTCHVSSNLASGKQTKRRSHVCLVEEVRIHSKCDHKAKREENFGEEKALSRKGSGVLECNALVDVCELGMNETWIPVRKGHVLDRSICVRTLHPRCM